METQNQPVACQCSGVLKGITVACAVLAVVLPWFGMMAALIGILLAVVSIVCAIIAVCKKATMFGIIMIVVGMIAGGIATGGYLFSVAKVLNLVDQGKIQVEFAKKIEAAQKAGDLKKVEELKKEQQEALEQYSQNLQKKFAK